MWAWFQNSLAQPALQNCSPLRIRLNTDWSSIFWLILMQWKLMNTLPWCMMSLFGGEGINMMMSLHISLVYERDQRFSLHAYTTYIKKDQMLKKLCLKKVDGWKLTTATAKFDQRAVHFIFKVLLYIYEIEVIFLSGMKSRQQFFSQWIIIKALWIFKCHDADWKLPLV